MNQLPDDLLKELLATFEIEAGERLAAANRHLVVLEKATDPRTISELVTEIFREVHSLKGAAGAVGLTGAQVVSHRLESLFERARAGEMLPVEQFDLVYEGLDAVAALVAEGASGTPADVDVDDLAERLEAAARAPGVKLPAVEPEPALPPATRADADETEIESATPEPRPDAEPARLGDDTIRVSTTKLDSLMGLVGELFAATIAADERLNEVARIHDHYSKWEREWREARPRYHKLLTELGNSDNGAFANGMSRSFKLDLHALLSFIRSSDEREQDAIRALQDLRRKFGVDGRRISQIVSDLQDEVRRTRMVPLSALLELVPRLARDVARSLGKEVDVKVSGAEIEVDRTVLEQLKDPLGHLVRNCIDHGLEDPDLRAISGKPRRGQLTLSAEQHGGSLTLTVLDDGRGIHPDAIRSAAVRKGILQAQGASALSDRDALDLIFRSGFSTSAIITDISGRGVGLDVVRDNVEKLHGLIEVETSPGESTRFTLTVPLSVSTTKCLMVRQGGEDFALPASNITRILRVESGDIGRADLREVVSIDDRPVPLMRLGDLVGSGSRAPANGKHPVVLAGSAERRVAFLVDELRGAHELVVKGLPTPFRRVRFAAGAAIIGAGQIAVVLNVADLVRAEHAVTQAGPLRPLNAESVTPARPVVLVVDDSIVTRTLERNILETAGYDVRVAADGHEAWQSLETQGIDLVVSDVEMPGLDGFLLTERIRGDERFANLPVVLVTSLDSQDHRRRGVEAGADAHIVKQAFNQDRLLETIQSLI